MDSDIDRLVQYLAKLPGLPRPTWASLESGAAHPDPQAR